MQGQVYFKVNPEKHKELAKQWLDKNEVANILKLVSKLICIAGGILTVVAIHKILTNVHFDAMAKSILVTGAVLLIFPVLFSVGVVVWKMRNSWFGGQLYYMSNMSLCCDNDNLMLAYHPYADRYSPESMLVNIANFKDIEYVQIDKENQLVTVKGNIKVELYRAPFGHGYMEKDSNTKYRKWSDFRFFMCLDKEDEEAFYRLLASKYVRIQYV